jgi:exosortase/archaeosortase family protein
MINPLAKLNENKGLKDFIIRTVIFSVILISVYLFVFLYFRHTQLFYRYFKIPEDFYFSFLTGLSKTDFLNAALFTVTLFIIWNRDTILSLKEYAQSKKETIVFGLLAVLIQVAHYAYKYYVRINAQSALTNTLLLTLLKYVFNVLFVVFLGLAVYNLQVFKDQFSKFKKQLPIFALFLVGYFFLIQFFQKIWLVMGNFVATAVYHMLDLTFDNVVLQYGTNLGPRLGVGKFVVGISDACSGIDSLLLFLSLYFVLLVLDWSRMNKKRMLILLPIGIVMTIAYNLVRVYLILLVGILYDPVFAVDFFHTNAGWVMFLIVFIIFWHFGSSYVYIKKQAAEEKASVESVALQKDEKVEEKTEKKVKRKAVKNAKKKK